MTPPFSLPLSPLALIRVGGADAQAFLQGQLSNDVRTLTETQGQLSSMNSPKGRMLAVLHLSREADAILLELHRSLLEPMLKRLRMYVLRSKVVLGEASDLVQFGLAGAQAADVLAALDLPVPAQAHASAGAREVRVTRRLGPTPRFSLRVAAAGAPALGAALAARAPVAGWEAWKRLDLEAGVPTVYPETQDRFVAQMCNLGDLGGISFDKGCYTGQEVIARVHYRGAVKRHMQLARLDGPAPAPGTKLPLGEVVDAVARTDGGSDALLVSSD